MYEKRTEPLLPLGEFIRRVVWHVVAALVFIGGSLAVGMIGYMILGHMDVVDAYLSATMILSGMGPVYQLPDDAAKLFAGTYALYSGVSFLVAAGVIFAPILHRLLHSLHLDDGKDGS